MDAGRDRAAFRRGFGRGARAWRHWFHATGLPGWMRFGTHAATCLEPDPGTEKQALRKEGEALQAELESVKKRLQEIESKTAAQPAP